MRNIILILTIYSFISLSSCSRYNKTKIEMTDTTLNDGFCNPETGICEIPTQNGTQENTIAATEKPITIVYYSDPICSACWGVEPVINKLKLVYGDQINIEYHMGGLLPNWEVMQGRVTPTKLAEGSKQLSHHYEMPLNGDVWLKDPLQSSYPPSIGFKAAQLQDDKKAELFLRRLRELLFVESKNIAKKEVLEALASEIGLDVERFKKDFDHAAKEAFESDLKLAAEMGVRGFPYFNIANKDGQSEIIYGIKPFEGFEQALLSVYPNLKKNNYNKDWNSLFSKYNALTTKEFAVLADISISEAQKALEELTSKNSLHKIATENGDLWRLKN